MKTTRCVGAVMIFCLLIAASAHWGCNRCSKHQASGSSERSLAQAGRADASSRESEQRTSDARLRRSCDGSAPGEIELVSVVRGLSQPLFVLSAPADADSLYILEKGGQVKRARANQETTTMIELDVKTDIEMGLLGMAFHPNFGSVERRIYLSYVDPAGVSTVSSFKLAEDGILKETEQVLFRVEQPAANHNGGMIDFGPDGWLYVGMGDGGGRDDQYGNGQDRSTPLGTILRLDVEHPERSVAGNLSGAGEDGRVFHYGLRNPWRFSFDRVTGDLYIGDVGQDDWEEINVLPRGAPSTNFGWPTFEGTHRCPACRTNVPPPSPDMEMPVHEYPRGPAGSVTGGYVYQGKKIPSLVGRYVYSDFVQNWIRTFTWDGERACDHHDLTPSLDPEGRLRGVSSFGEDAEGELYVVNFAGGEVFRIAPKG